MQSKALFYYLSLGAPDLLRPVQNRLFITESLLYWLAKVNSNRGSVRAICAQIGAAH